MIALLARFIDWYILQCWWALRLSRLNLTPETSKPDQAIQFLNGPNLIPAHLPTPFQPLALRRRLQFFSNASNCPSLLTKLSRHLSSPANLVGRFYTSPFHLSRLILLKTIIKSRLRNTMNNGMTSA